MLEMDDKERMAKFQRAVMKWFAQNARDLPWRGRRDAYTVWVSEIMLQQTQVQQVIPYFLRFIRAFPDVASLAAAPLDHVLKIWEGMGYYSRARNLHYAAGQIMSEYGGIFPQDLHLVQKLKGIGPYTAAAILSIAFNQPYAAVDGNVLRVLCRLLAWPKTPKESKKSLQEVAQKFLPERQPGLYNEALMEVGAIICTPQRPACAACPITEFCQAYAQGAQGKYPIRASQKPRPHYTVAAALIWRDDQLLIARRPEKGMLGGLWEFPGGKQEGDETLAQTAAREAWEELGVQIKVGELFMTIKHQYTHFSITLHVFNSEYLRGEPKAIGCSDFCWVKVPELRQLAFPRANGKIIEKLLAPTG